MARAPAGAAGGGRRLGFESIGAAWSEIPHQPQNVWPGVSRPQFAQRVGGPIPASLASSSRPRWIVARSQSRPIAAAIRVAPRPAVTSRSDPGRGGGAMSSAPPRTASTGIPSQPSALRSRTGARKRSQNAAQTEPTRPPGGSAGPRPASPAGPARAADRRRAAGRPSAGRSARTTPNVAGKDGARDRAERGPVEDVVEGPVADQRQRPERRQGCAEEGHADRARHGRHDVG